MADHYLLTQIEEAIRGLQPGVTMAQYAKSVDACSTLLPAAREEIARLRDRLKQVCDKVRVAACGPYHSMGSTFEEVDSLVQRIESADAELASLREQVRIARDALTKITKMGRVCDNFELCTHPPCEDSCGAVLASSEALAALSATTEAKETHR